MYAFRKEKFEFYLILIFIWLAVTFYTAPNIMTRLVWAITLIVSGLYVISKTIDLKIKKENIKVFIMASAWILPAILITPVALDKYAHFQLLSISLAYIFFSLIIISYLHDRNALFASLMYIIFFWAVAEVVCFSFFLHTNGQLFSLNRRFIGTYYNPNTLGVTSVFLFIYSFVFGRIVLRRKFLKNLLLIFILVISFASASTKAAIGLFLVIIFYSLLQKKSFKHFIVFMCVLFFSISLLFLFGETYERLTEKIENYSQWNEAIERGGRPFLIAEGIKIIKEYPITGVGVHNSQYYLYTPRYKKLLERGLISEDSPGVYSHNNYIEMGLNAGIFSIIIFYAPIIYVLIKSYCIKRLFSPLKEVRIFIVITILIKLFFDIAMVSYNSFIHIFVIVLCFIFYFSLLRPGRYGFIQSSKI